MKVKDEALRIVAEEMEAIDAHAGCYIEKELTERDIILEFEIRRQAFRLKDEPVLQ